MSICNESDAGLNSHLNKEMTKNTYEINVGSKKIKFNLQDPIFSLDEPTTEEFSHEASCVVCDKELGKKHKNACQFCGHKACDKCAYKLRTFANQTDLVA
jgi:rRNA maturation endonuclease Nob1